MIKIENLHKVYNKGLSAEFHALKGITTEIAKGEFVSIEGKSGAGKSTLLHIIGCIDKPTSGGYFFENLNVSTMKEHQLAQLRNTRIGFVLQDFALLSSKTVLQNVALPLYFGNTRLTDIRRKCLSALESVGIEGLHNKKVSQLSGGQKQRVAIARAIVNDPELILADEPTGSLDSKTAGEIMDLLKTMNSTGKTVVVVTHDKQVSSYCSRKITISDGVISDDRCDSERAANCS